jgi:hypothetical protein
VGRQDEGPQEYDHGEVAESDRPLNEERSQVEAEQRRHRCRGHSVEGRDSEKWKMIVDCVNLLRPAAGLGV